MKDQWIFNSFIKDFWALWGLAFLAIVYMQFYPTQMEWGLLALITYVLIDTGHVYITALRTYFDKEELSTSKRYWVIPALLFFIFSAWTYFGIPWFWAFVVYATFYHNTRQHFGIFAWYAKINKNKRGWGTFFLYSLTVLPFVGMHFRSGLDYSLFPEGSVFFYPNPSLFMACLAANLFLIAALLVYGLRKVLKQDWSFPLLASLLFPGLINCLCFLFGPSEAHIMIPVLIVHGVAYFFLVGWVKNRQYPIQFSLLKMVFAILGIATLFGSLEVFLTDQFLEISQSEFYRGKIFLSLGISAVTVPTISHYIFDGSLWTKDNAIFARSLKP